MRKKVVSIILAAALLLSQTLVAFGATFDNASIEELKNVALGQKVSATSSYIPPEGFFSESFLVDGEWKTYANGNVKLGWNTDTVGATLGENDPVDIIIELDDVYKISKVILKPMMWSNGDNFPRDYELLGSIDGENWTLLACDKDVNAHAPSDTAVVPITYDVPASDIVYFKMHITKHSKSIDQSGSYISSIGEIELMGYLSDIKVDESNFTINKYALVMNPGETDTLFLTNGKRKINRELLFSSSNEAVASVDKEGNVKSIAKGNATIKIFDTSSKKDYEVNVIVDDYRVTDKFQIVGFIPFFYENDISEKTFDNLKQGGITNVELNFALDSKTITYENNLKTLKLAYERGLDVTVSEQDFSGATWPVKSDAEILEFVKKYSHLPGVSGYYITDEPSDAVPFARAISIVKSVMPNAIAHMNFCGAYDNIVTNLQNELVNKYNSSLDYIMYDAYVFRNKTCAESTLYSQLRYNREIGHKLGVNTATYIQSMAWNNCNRPDANAIRYQVYASLASGVKQISYFCWQTPRANAYETYGPAIIDINGNPTDLFEPVSKINAKVQALGPTLMKLDTRELYCTGTNFGDGYVELPAGFFITPVDWDMKLAFSYMTEEGTSRPYSMIVNRDYNAPAKVDFKALNGISELYYYDDNTGNPVRLKASNDGIYTVDLDAGEGVLITTNPDYNFELKEVTNFVYLEKALKNAKDIDLSLFREEGKADFKNAVNNAEAILNNSASLQKDVDNAIKKLQTTQSKLRLIDIEGSNLALNKKVIASDSYEDGIYFSSEYVIDGINVPLEVNTHAGWSVNPFSVMKRNDVVDVTVDLGDVYKLSSIILCPTVYNNGKTFPEDFEIQVSVDGKSFKTVKNVQGVILSDAINQIYTLDYEEASFVRIHITKHSSFVDATGGSVSQIGEIEVYGKNKDDIIDTPENTPDNTPGNTPDYTPEGESSITTSKPDNTPSKSAKGCGSAIISSSSVILGLIGSSMVIFFRKRK